MSYLVFARKWRPQDFDQIIGQEHIATTFKNAIALKRVGHAYLFSGPRGVGKTSTARILAKALNCEKGPIAKPCGKCDSCQEITQGRSLDVIEIDGASNRGIEQIRQLRENVKFAPAKGRFKIYIIDEVHQITTDGFNALLKTLEEPPAHVKFIFATTQAHKVLSTILSRCQRFNFKPLSVGAISEKLAQVVQQEGLKVSKEALVYIARAASGSMRDAESILDQLCSFCKEKIEPSTVTTMLGMVDFELLQQISQQIIQRNSQSALLLVEEVINDGRDLTKFIAALTEHFRNILVAKTVKPDTAQQLIDLPADFIKQIIQQAQDLDLAEIFYSINILIRAQESLRRALSERVVVEMAVLKLAQRESLVALPDILSRLEELEQRTRSTGSAPTPEKPQARNYPLPPQNKEQLPYPQEQEDSSQADPAAEVAPSQQNAQPEPPAVAQAQGDDLHHNWLRLLQVIKGEKMFLASVMELAEVADFKNNCLTVIFPQDNVLHKETLERPENKKFIETRASEVFGFRLQIRFMTDKDTVPEWPKIKTAFKELGKKLSEEPIVQSALNMFQGRVVRQD